MSRKNKLKKLERRRQRGISTHVHRLSQGHESLPREGDGSSRFYLSEYSISYEPIKGHDDGKANFLHRKLGDERMEELNEMIYEQPARAVEQLEPLLERYPDVPMLYNWLAAACSAIGNLDRAEELARLNYERNPHYLFARANYAQFLMESDRLDEVPKVFDNTWDLRMLYPHRSVFHVTEFVSFAAVAVQYMMRTGEQQAAQTLFDAMKEIAPDAHQTQVIERIMRGSWLLNATRGLLGKIAPRRVAT